MDIEVIEEKENPLLERKELIVKISHSGAMTPRRGDIRNKIIAKLSADEDKFILGPLNQHYGTTEAVAKVKIYKSKERALQIESPNVIKKNFKEEQPPAKPKEEKSKEAEKPEGRAKKEEPSKPEAGGKKEEPSKPETEEPVKVEEKPASAEEKTPQAKAEKEDKQKPQESSEAKGKKQKKGEG
jgi:small subunit ribosomal protein S24e